MRPLVLNTRSKNQAGELTAQLKGAGFDVLEIPALDISNLNSSEPILAALGSLDSEDVVAFTSANAAIFASDIPEIREILKKLKIAAIGDKTAAALRENKIPIQIQSEQISSEDLADAIAAHRPKKVLYLSGLPNTGTLRKKLTSLTDFEEIPVYASTPSKNLRQQLVELREQLQKVNYFVFLSRETLNALHDAADSLGEDLRDRSCVVISTRVAEAARVLGYKTIVVSQARSVEAIVSTLVELSAGIG